MTLPEPEEMGIIPTYAEIAKTQEVARIRRYQSIRSALTDTNKTPENIQTLLNDEDLELPALRNLFGALRRSFLQALWDYRQVELWIKRAKGLGVEYADIVAEDESVAKYPSRYVFFREMDEGLHMEMEGSGERKEIVGMILRHVRVLRETVEEVRGLREEKGRMVRGEMGFVRA